jgi:putative hydrolase of HD superfamily
MLQLADRNGTDDKFKRELDSMRYICDELLKPISEAVANEFMELWAEYEAGETKEAVFVKDGAPSKSSTT